MPESVALLFKHAVTGSKAQNSQEIRTIEKAPFFKAIQTFSKIKTTSGITLRQPYAKSSGIGLPAAFIRSNGKSDVCFVQSAL